MDLEQDASCFSGVSDGNVLQVGPSVLQHLHHVQLPRGKCVHFIIFAAMNSIPGVPLCVLTLCHLNCTTLRGTPKELRKDDNSKPAVT